MKKLVLAMAAASLLSASAWAERFALTGTPGAAYYAVTLNEDVYAHAHEASLGDLRVLNGDGEPVPFSLDIPRDAPPQARALYDVHWFAAPVDDAQKPGTAGVVLGADGVLRATGTAAPQETTRSWLVDLSQLHDRKTATVTALVVALPAVEFQSGVNVQASDDLQHWSPVAQATLFRLSNQGSTLVQDRVEFTGLRAKYLRLTWQGKPPAPEAVRAEVAMGAPVAAADSAIQWRAGLAPVQTPSAGDYQFDTGGVFPVERVKVRLPQANTVAQATLYARADAQAPWRLITSARLYRLAGAGGQAEQENAPISVPATADRYWRLQVDTRSGGLGAGAPQLSVGWRPATVTYAARGSVPFSLAIGEVARGNPVARTDLLAGASPAIAPAQLGTMTDSPADALTAEPPAGRTRQWILWGALVAAVAVLAAMAWKLFQTPATPPDASP